MAVSTREHAVFAALDRDRVRRERRFSRWLLASVGVGLVTLAALLVQVGVEGIPRLSLDFITGLPSRFPTRAGAFPAIMGTIWVIGVTAVATIPIGIGAAIYLEEYARKGRLARWIEVNVSNLAGVPSITYGLLGLGLFVEGLALRKSILAAGLTLGLLVLPVVITASREAIRAVPASIREAALAVGATQWQTIERQVLPAAVPGIVTGVILALSRAIGEAAPLIVVGALGSVFFAPNSVFDQFTVLPVQIFNWVRRPQPDFEITAAAGIVVLLGILLVMNGIAIAIRNRYTRTW
ncbi:MAG TPA: phosphate ABC transporter permease PstA [Actinomycetota bacterium]